MRTTTLVSFTIALLISVAVRPAHAANASASDPAVPPEFQAQFATTIQQLHSDRWETRDPASMRVMHELYPKLMSARAYGAAAQIVLEATLAVPGELDRIEVFQLQRVQALLRGGKPQEAMAAAKGLYNVTGMGKTREAISYAAQALMAAFPDQRDITRRFYEEQLEGSRASTQPFQRNKPAGRPSRILSSVKVDPKPYEDAIKREQGESFGPLKATGNLLLLCDRPEEAMQVFEKAYAVAPDDRLALATENLARAIKAMDGTIGRANAFVLSVRPKLAN